MIVMLSASVLYAQDFSGKKIVNAQTKAEIQHNMDLEKQQLGPNTGLADAIPGLNKYYGIQNVNSKAYQTGEKKVKKEQKVAKKSNSLMFSTSNKASKSATEFTGAPSASSKDPVNLECPGGSQLNYPGTPPEGVWSFGVADVDFPFERYQYFSGLPSDITSLTFWGLQLETGFVECDEAPADFNIIIYDDHISGGPDLATILYSTTVSITPTLTGEIYHSTLQLEAKRFTTDFGGTPISETEGWLSIQGFTGATCWFWWLNTPYLGQPYSYENDGSGPVLSDQVLSMCFGGDLLEHDVACTAILQPNSAEGLTSTEQVEISIYNAGTTTESFFDVFYQIDGGLAVVEQFDGPIDPGETLTHLFAATADLSVEGQSYSFHACTDLALDMNTFNDCADKIVVHLEPCVVVCPPGATDEGEGVIPDDTNDIINGGCNSDPNVFGVVGCGETVCGSTGFYVTDGSNYRDTDWYTLDLSGYGDPQDVTIVFEAGYTMVGGIVQGPCATAAFIDYAIPGPCEVTTVTVTGLDPAGEYWVWMGADFTAGDADWSPYYFTVSCVAAPLPPANDDMCGALPIIVDAPPITGDNSYSTVETAWPEVQGGCWLTAASNTVWYSFVAPATTAVVVNTDFVTPNDDTELTVYDLTFGDCTNPSLTELGCGEDDGVTGYGYMAIAYADGLIPGVVYYIQVDGWSTTVGEFMIEVTAVEPCVVVCPPGSTPENEGVIPDDTFDVTNGGCNGTPELFGTVNCGETVCGTTGFYMSGTAEYRDTDWYLLDLTGGGPQDVSVEFEAGYSIVGIILQAPCPATQLTSYVAGPCEVGSMSQTGLAPGEYYIFMGADFTGGDADWTDYYFTVYCEDAAPPPPNDECVDATTIMCDDGVIYGTTVAATLEVPTPPFCVTSVGGPGVWYYLEGTDQLVSLDLCNGNTTITDTKLHVYTGDCGALVCETGNDDDCGLLSAVGFFGELGVGYYILVSNYSTFTTSGTFELTINCVDPVIIDGVVEYKFGPTPLDYVDVNLNDMSDAIVASTVTASDGSFGFTGNYPAGDYYLTLSRVPPRGGTDVNDMNLVIDHILGTLLTGVEFLAAEVTGDGVVNVNDMNLMIDEIIGGAGYPAVPPYMFSETLFTVTGAKETFNLMVESLCSGDPAPSYVPPSLEAPNNDLCDDITIVVNAPPVPGDNTNSDIETWEVGGSCWFGTGASHSIWYSFAAPVSGYDVQITTDFVDGGTLGDTQITLYRLDAGPCENPTLTEIGCDDDAGTVNGLRSIITASGLTPSEVYYVQVDGYNENVGNFTIAVNEVLPCIVICPPGSTDEGEGVIPDDTYDVTNGGCNSTPNVFSSVACDETVCGTAGFYLTDGSSFRDTDWYELVIPAGPNQNVTVVFEAEFLIQGYILNGTCPSPGLVVGYLAQPCEIGTMTALNLAPGTYMIFMGPDFASTADWDEYYFTVTCEDAAVVVGCEHNTLWPSATVTVDGTGLLTTISTCNYAGEYSNVTGFVIGETYEFTMSDGGTGAYISVRTGVAPANLLVEGVSPVTWVATQTDITVHWSLDAACTTDASCHTTTVQCTTCP